MKQDLVKIIQNAMELLPKGSTKIDDFCVYLDSLRYFASNIKQSKPSSYFLTQFNLLDDNLKSQIDSIEINNYEDINDLIQLHWEFLEQLNKVKVDTKKQEINQDCLKCYSFKDNKCMNNLDDQCNCENPILSFYINDSQTLGLCKNCGHMVIKNGNQFLHHRKSYQCKSPYIDRKCGSPKGLKHNFYQKKQKKLDDDLPNIDLEFVDKK